MAKKTTGLSGLMGSIKEEAKQVKISGDSNLTASLFLKIPVQAKRKLDIYCVMNNKKKQDVITELINSLPEKD